MRLNPFCMCCIVNKQEKLLRQFDDTAKKTAYLQKVMGIMAGAKDQDCAPSIAVDINKLFRQTWGTEEDFTDIKHEYNQLMLNIEDQLEETIRSSEDPLETALLFARIGNYIDFAAMVDVNKEKMLEMIQAENKEHLDSTEYANFKRELSKASKMVYLTDNCGEIVLDKQAVKIIQEMYPSLDITVIVRGLPFVNDATMVDAEEVGFPAVAKVIGNGSDVGGTWFPGVNQETKDLLNSADLILSKGQGNFETLNDCGLNIYYLFLCKCEWFQKLFQAKPLQGMFVNERRVTPDR